MCMNFKIFRFIIIFRYFSCFLSENLMDSWCRFDDILSSTHGKFHVEEEYSFLFCIDEVSVKALLLRLNLACFKLGKDRLRSKSAKDDQLRPVRYLSSDIRHFSLQWKHTVFMTTVIENKSRNRWRVQKQESLKKFISRICILFQPFYIVGCSLVYIARDKKLKYLHI